MQNYALSIANYFIMLSQQEDRVIRPLKLMKLVYIAHGYLLALLDKPTTGAKLEKVEAWQYGPVFPSVYYSFKQYGSNPITKMTSVFDFDNVDNGIVCEFVPMIDDENTKKICDFVWRKYAIYTDSSLVSILHADGTPWKQVYKKGENVTIDDTRTKRYPLAELI